MTKRFILEQNGNFHTVIDTVENKPLGVFEFKENEFPVYACFHMIIDRMNELYEDLKHELKASKALRDVIIEFENENKQLKSDNQYHKEFIGDVLSDFNRLEEENEQLKKQFIMILIKLGKKTHVIQCKFCKHGEYYNIIEKGYYHEHHFRCVKDYKHKLGLRELCPYWEINIKD